MTGAEDRPATPDLAKAGKPRLNARRTIAAIMGAFAILIGFSAWAMSSPVGSSPDDDYHLGSIWCPWPVTESGCRFQEVDAKQGTVEIPSSVVGSAACYAFHPENSAECTDGLSDTDLVRTNRFDEGTYPPGYYHFHNLFVGNDVFHTVVVMRMVNVVLGIGALGLVALFAPRRLQQNLFLASVVSWVPMGVYYIASNNPSSWAITGCLIYASALIAAAWSTGWRKWVLLGLMAIGTLLAALSRADSGFYLFVITLAVWFYLPITRTRMAAFVGSLISTAFGLLMLLTSGQAGTLTDSGGWPVDMNASLLTLLRRNVQALPEFISGFWGVNSGPGWFDTPLPGWSTYLMLFVAGGALFVGARQVWTRKILAATVLLGAIAGIPVVSMVMRHVYPVTYYQSRYLLPLLAVFFLIWLADRKAFSLFDSSAQLVLLVTFASIANAVALGRTMQRYTVGIDQGSLSSPDWWPWPIGTITTLAIGSLAMALGLAILAWLTLEQRRDDARAERAIAQ